MNRNFLIVDDSRISRHKFNEFASELGSNIIDEAEDGLIACKRFEEQRYDYIIMDLEMPNMNGNEAAKLMLAENPNTNIILVTSLVDKKELLGALNIGIKKILKKPVSFEIFAKAIKELEIKG